MRDTLEWVHIRLGPAWSRRRGKDLSWTWWLIISWIKTRDEKVEFRSEERVSKMQDREEVLYVYELSSAAIVLALSFWLWQRVIKVKNKERVRRGVSEWFSLSPWVRLWWWYTYHVPPSLQGLTAYSKSNHGKGTAWEMLPSTKAWTTPTTIFKYYYLRILENVKTANTYSNAKSVTTTWRNVGTTTKTADLLIASGWYPIALYSGTIRIESSSRLNWISQYSTRGSTRTDRS